LNERADVFESRKIGSPFLWSLSSPIKDLQPKDTEPNIKLYLFFGVVDILDKPLPSSTVVEVPASPGSYEGTHFLGAGSLYPARKRFPLNPLRAVVRKA